jgi:hypothetical protein
LSLNELLSALAAAPADPAGERRREEIMRDVRGTWAWMLALAAGLGMVALARADDDNVAPAKTGNWFTRIFVRDPAKKKDKKDEHVEPAPLSPAQIRQKAQWEWQRRVEVCEKLRQIALETGDQELSRKADALDQRAWDLYVQRTGGSPNMPPFVEQTPEGQNAAPRAKGSPTAVAPSLGLAPAGTDVSGADVAGASNIDGRTAARRE